MTNDIDFKKWPGDTVTEKLTGSVSTVIERIQKVAFNGA